MAQAPTPSRPPVVPLVRHSLQKCLQFKRPLHAHFKIDSHPRVRIVAPVPAQPVPHRLGQHIPVRSPALHFIAQASIEIIVTALIALEGKAALWKEIVDQFRDRTMQKPHHLRQALVGAQLADRVIVIAQKRSRPRRELPFARVVLEAIPEDPLGILGVEGRVPLDAATGDEIDLVAAIPVLEAVLIVDDAFPCAGTASDAVGFRRGAGHERP